MATLSEQEQKEPLLEQFKETRNRTLEIVKTLEKDDFVVQTAFYMSPPKWHVGHVSWIYEAIMSKLDKDYEFYSKEFSEYLNSYYQQFGVPHDKGARGVISRPTVDQVFQYFNNVNQRVENFIKSKTLAKEDIRLITMGFHHECQHQELMIYDLQHLLADQYIPVKKNNRPTSVPVEKKSVSITGGIYVMGYSGDTYCYDIELPEHKVFLNDYKIDAFPITNSQYLEFMEDGGYNNYKYWLSDGWEKVKKNEWESPMYWEKIEGKWMVRDFLGLREINPNEPVCHVSYYEAEAYCKWSGKRLPTEAEWEKAACWNESKQQKTIFPWGDGQPNQQNSNLLESHLWGCTEVGAYPAGVSHYGCHQMIGDVWEWTSSEFTGYPGFKSGFDEYNDKWFTNQKVLRGGSFGTPKMSIRGSYRNFFRLDERWLFSGFRCAENA
ncbi:MAG: ergothioneine biosynthesis protein EgtB [Candidatus Nitrosomaritimum aestuariumsis]|jgi:ergothioneine biosynthesis protein EgtB|nr:ergothioneine biosynthesis protein EgtB [Nitrosopumilaceae archaeon]